MAHRFGAWTGRYESGSDDRRTWELQLGRAEISSGGIWTEAWRDSNGRLIRACGDSGDNTAITCTTWY
ncbi:hypothetical protein GTY41_29295 [Streptomyces sp. SID685]|uniref:hypothetical protein n=1 Tax=Streptomyces sp. SID685 TaxID=2690322 RepID=UPI00136D9E0D|nr:hypothetical protein [Streptomyces sp. SID685]MYR88904.1 hypothetical protein [Streptomyces sp. SID685]